MPTVLMVDAEDLDTVEDKFNYHEASNVKKRSFAPQDWNNVTCHDVRTCVSLVRAAKNAWYVAHASCHHSFKLLSYFCLPFFVLCAAWMADELGTVQ
jgi:hypothetical protein